MLRRNPRKDPVTPEVRVEVLRRDHKCFLSRIEPSHGCRDQWGDPHSPYATDRLTLDHVKRQARMGVRAPSDAAHLLAMCHGANVGVPSRAVREAERSYLAELYPEAWA